MLDLPEFNVDLVEELLDFSLFSSLLEKSSSLSIPELIGDFSY
jgi:hypothetical protein